MSPCYVPDDPNGVVESSAMRRIRCWKLYNDTDYFIKRIMHFPRLEKLLF